MSAPKPWLKPGLPPPNVRRLTRRMLALSDGEPSDDVVHAAMLVMAYGLAHSCPTCRTAWVAGLPEATLRNIEVFSAQLVAGGHKPPLSCQAVH